MQAVSTIGLGTGTRRVIDNMAEGRGPAEATGYQGGIKTRASRGQQRVLHGREEDASGAGAGSADDPIAALSEEVDKLRIETDQRRGARGGRGYAAIAYRRGRGRGRGAGRGRGGGGRGGGGKRGERSGTKVPPSENVKFYCLGCNQYAFDSTRVYCIYKYNYVILDVDLHTRTLTRPHPEPGDFTANKTYAKVDKLMCRGCGHDWGISGRDVDTGTVYDFLKLAFFRVVYPQQSGYHIDHCTSWSMVRVRLPAMSSEAEQQYLRDLRTKQQPSHRNGFTITQTLTPAGATATDGVGVTIHIPPGAVRLPSPPGDQHLQQPGRQDGGAVQLLVDTVVLCTNLHEFVQPGEQFISPSVQFEPIEDDPEYKFNRNIVVTIRHNANVVKNIRVYKGEHRNEDELEPVEIVARGKTGNEKDDGDDNGDDGDGDSEDYCTVDTHNIHIHTRRPRLYTCTEVDRAVCVPTVFTVCVFTKHEAGQSGWLQVQCYVYDHREVLEQYLKRFHGIMSDFGYEMQQKLIAESFENMEPQNVLNVLMTASTGADRKVKMMSNAYNRKLDVLFSLLQRRLPGQGVAYPQPVSLHRVQILEEDDEQVSVDLSLEHLTFRATTGAENTEPRHQKYTRDNIERRQLQQNVNLRINRVSTTLQHTEE